MTASKDKTLNVWQVPKQWIKEEAPEDSKEDEEEKFRTRKLENILEEQKIEEERGAFEEDFSAPLDPYQEEEVRTSNPSAAFQNIEKGFDPLGGGVVKSKDVKQDDDDLIGWYN